MIICLGPICFPIWQLFPVLLLLFAKAKSVYYWMIGKPIPVDDSKKEDSANEPLIGSGDAHDKHGGMLRQRKAGGVTGVSSSAEWKQLLKVGPSGGGGVEVEK